jgi:hypothetical protein
VSIESYGGNPDIVATREEIERTAFQLKQCAEELAAWPHFEALLTDPLHQIQFRVASIGIHQKLQRLYSHCILASENYFTLEAQISRRFEITFVPELARVVLALATTAGWKLDNNVQAQLVSDLPARKPTSVTDLLDRLWQLSSKDQPMIGVDIFQGTGNQKLAVVYVPGTQVFGYGENPLDMTSNVQAMGAASSAASEKAVLLAIKQAGIESSDEVILVGHSQGGMIAGNLASNPSGFIAAGLVTFGAPLAQLRNLKAPVMAIEHVNDPVPNISGRANPNKANWVTVQRVSEKPESNALMFSHSLKAYKNTTTQIDSSSDVGINNVRSKVFEKLKSAKPLRSLQFVISRESR